MASKQQISLDQAERMMRDGKVLVLDVRSFGDYHAGHYPRAIHLSSANLRLLLKHTNPQVAILIYGYNSSDSRERADLFADFGFKNCFSLKGGYQAWFQTLQMPQRAICA